MKKYHKISLEIPGFSSLSLLADISDAALCFVEFGNNTSGEMKSTPLLQEAGDQILQYLSGNLTRFKLPLKYAGSAFQVKIWNTLKQIPYGQVISYKQLAAKAGYPNAFRAAGMANNKNPLPIIIPCHRVVNHNGKPGGYAAGIEIKKKLLIIEGIKWTNDKM